MADIIIHDQGERLPTPEEKALIDFFAKAELGALATLEAGAREIITLVTALYGVLFGVLAVGSHDFALALRTPFLAFLGTVACGALLVALLAALAVVIPGEHWLRGNSLAAQKQLYDELRRTKASRLVVAVVAFGIGLLAFAISAVILLWWR